MKMVKSLILGSAAGLLAMGGAQAADLPVKAKAVEYVRICSLYGAGFYYIPGTDTCIKLGGYLRVETAFNTNSVFNGQYGGVGGAHNRLSNYFTTRSREDFNIDTRTATEYGVVRTYFDATFSWTTDQYVGNPNNATGLIGGTIYSPIGGGVGVSPASAPNNANAGAVAGGTVGVYYAFIQFAGFTMGKAISQFSAPWTNYPANNFDGLVGGGGTVTGVNQFSYTAQFGNGVSGTISLQDPTAYYQAGVQNLSGLSGAGIQAGAYGVNNLGGTRAPDIVGMLRVDQAWGLAQLSVAGHNNHAGYYGALETSGHPDDKWGWAIQGALSIKNIPTGAGDSINLQAVYTDGATRYNLQDLAAVNYAMWGGSNAVGAYQSLGFANAPDAVYTGTTLGAQSQLENIKTWGFRGGYTHNWDPYWNTGVYGAYAQIKYGDLGRNTICAAFVALLAPTAGIAGCNPDFNIAQVGIITRWTPVKNLTFSADLTYTRLDQKYSGLVTLPATLAIAKPGTQYELKDQDSINMLIRAQRNW
jgi:Porin subfamily